MCDIYIDCPLHRKNIPQLFAHIKYIIYFCTANQHCDALLAQLVEQLTLNQWVQSSNL